MHRTISSESLFGLIGSDVHLNPKSSSAAVCDPDLDEASSLVPLWRIRQKTQKEKKGKKRKKRLQFRKAFCYSGHSCHGTHI
jgi:hypothetical protein